MKIPISIPAETFKVRLIDIVVFLIILGILSFLIYIASEWGTPYDRTLEINLNPSNIPQYALQSVARIFSAIFISCFLNMVWIYCIKKPNHEK